VGHAHECGRDASVFDTIHPTSLAGNNAKLVLMQQAFVTDWNDLCALWESLVELHRLIPDSICHMIATWANNASCHIHVFMRPTSEDLFTWMHACNHVIRLYNDIYKLRFMTVEPYASIEPQIMCVYLMPHPMQL
jgi:hypothetical protein